jgi:hypothetical protein
VLGECPVLSKRGVRDGGFLCDEEGTRSR